MASRKLKRPGRPSTTPKTPDTIRQIPLALRHGDVLEFDKAAARAKISRAEWCRHVLRKAVA